MSRNGLMAAWAIRGCFAKLNGTSVHGERPLCYQHYCTLQKAGTSQFWKRKMLTLFRLHDLDGDGCINWNDYEQIERRLGSMSSQISAKHQIEIMLNFRKLWEHCLGPVKERHLSVTQENFIKALQRAINQPAYKTTDKQEMPVWALFYKIFKLMDFRNNSAISPREFTVFFQVYGLSEQVALRSFSAIDTNGDGYISIDEFVNVAIDFLYSEDESSIGHEIYDHLTKSEEVDNEKKSIAMQNESF